MAGVVVLALRVRFGCERIFPAEVIPIINVERDGHEIFPQLRTVLQARQPRFGGRTTAASFGGVEFEQRGLRRSTLELNEVGAHELRCGEEQRAERECGEG